MTTYRDILASSPDRERITKILGVDEDAEYEPTHGESLTSTYVYAVDESRIGASHHEGGDDGGRGYEMAATMLKILADLYLADPVSVALLLTRINHPDVSNRELALLVGMKKTVIARRLKVLAEKHPALDRALYSYSSSQAMSQRERRDRERRETKDGKYGSK